MELDTVGRNPSYKQKNILEPVKRVTEALALLRDNDFCHPFHGFLYLYLLNEWFRC